MDKLEVAVWGLQVRAEGSIGIIAAVFVVVIVLLAFRYLKRPWAGKPDRTT